MRRETALVIGDLELETLSGSRFELALDLFRSGRAFVFDGVAFALRDGVVESCVASSWDISRITEESAEDEFQHARAVLERIFSTSEAFARIARGLPQVFILAHDYGNGAVEICRKTESQTTWTRK